MVATESLSLGGLLDPACEKGPTPGEILDGRYRVQGPLGQGAMGIVYAARDVWLDRTVAIKLVDPLRMTPAAFELFQKEARTLARIRHGNVLQIHSFGLRAGAPYFVAEYVEGSDLGGLIDDEAARGCTVPLGRALEIIRDVARGLGAVHDANLVHRDVKPTNILIEKGTGRSVLIDFGLACRSSRTTPKISDVGGTPWYMAPEQARDWSGASTTARADIYALACTAYELFTGRLVFEHIEADDALRAHAEDAAPPISRHIPRLAPLDPVFARALAKAPEDRYPSCAAFMEALDDAAREALLLPSNPPRPSSPPPLLRVVLLQRNESLRRHVERIVDRTLRAHATDVEIEHVECRAELFAAFACEAAHLIIVDAESVSVDMETLIEAIRRAPGGVEAELLVLARNVTDSPRLVELGTRQLPKPVNMNALAMVIGRMGARAARTAAGSLRRSRIPPL
jgi:eukaryotic-like serine/threonine-protein kinase